MFPLLVFLLFYFFSPAAADLAADGSALIAFRNAVGRMVLPWNTSLSPCKWKGVVCSSNGVTSLRLPGRGLIGQIPTGTLGNLSNLHSLSLHRNALFGPLPSDLARCTHLHFLYLNQNRFSGQIPPFISSITSLIHLNLADNNFSGEIPLSLNNLRHLNLLYLESNHFSGDMPNMDIPKLERFNVSFNRLKGPVPEKLRGMPASAFLGMSMCGGPLQPCLGKAPLKLTHSSSLAGGAIAGIALGAFFLFILVLAVLFLFFRRKGEAEEANFTETPGAKLPELAIKGKEMAASSAPPPGIAVSKKQLVFLGNAPRLFDLEDLLRSSAEVLGKGTYGIAYKAALDESLVVAVKRLKNVKMPEKEFAEKIKAISAVEHPNLVPLRAYYYSREEKFLVYDYMPLGSLSSLLHGNRGSSRTPLKWETRIKIALEAARGIECIHSTSPSTSHGNIKSSNILITSSYRARVSEHGLSHLAPPSSQNLTPEADVYSFGVLLLELVTGKAPAHGGRFVNLPRWVEETLIRGEGTRELFDEELTRFRSPEEEMLMLLQVGLDCTSQNPDHRPGMSSVVAKIEEIRHWAARKKDKLKEKEGPVF
ncbi:hypothetical protein M5K25_025460 [Dendrobium thyrsiflorum]|uniref:Protein kinase domain-containing protein n=1 Tax=Dendrobium thyrsiflorum TaxID=117978 RepID=A0ABD0U4B3_DENTH